MGLEPQEERATRLVRGSLTLMLISFAEKDRVSVVAYCQKYSHVFRPRALSLYLAVPCITFAQDIPMVLLGLALAPYSL
jgi:hypothetical protein